MEVIQANADGSCGWIGYCDFSLLSPDGVHKIELSYAGEPPHGDSYHRVTIDGKKFPWLAWGCNFAFTSSSTHLVFSAMKETISRYTMVVDLKQSKYFVLPSYIYEFRLEWPRIEPAGHSLKEKIEPYCFNGQEMWTTFN